MVDNIAGANLPSYPADPLDEKLMNEFVLLSVDKEQNYKKYSDKIGASCAESSKTPLKVQKIVIDRIKEVIKAKPQRHTAKQKFFALKLLNKVVMKKNIELNNYVEAKIMSRLTILAEYNNNPEEKSAQLLLSRGKNIFGPDEPDHQNSANFLIILLDCIEKWALTFAFEEGDLDDAASNFTISRSGKQDKFYRCYTKLLEKGVKFPSTFQNKDKQAASQKKKPSEAPQASRPPADNQIPADDAQSQNTAMTYGISPEKKDRIAQLKKKMQRVKEMSKQAKKFVEKAAQITDIAQVLQLQQVFQENHKLGEDAIKELMSDDIQPHISNSAQLAEKLFGYQDLYEKALQKVEEKLEEQKKLEEDMAAASRGQQKPPNKGQERRNSFGSDENANVDEGVAPDDDNRIVMSRQSMGGGRASRMAGGDMQPNRQAMMTNTTNTVSEINFQFASGQSPPSSQKKRRPGQFDTQLKQADPYDFDDFGAGGAANQIKFSTNQKQPQGFDDFNFNMPPPQGPQEDKKQISQPQNDFGFDFSDQKPDPSHKAASFRKEKPKTGAHSGHKGEEEAENQPTGDKMAPAKAAASASNLNDFDENYKSNDFMENPDDFSKNEDGALGGQFDGRKQVNKSLKNKNNMGEFQARNSQIQGQVSKFAEQRQSISGKPPSASQNDFDFNFGGGDQSQNPQSQKQQSNKQVAQNDGFDFQFDQPAPDQDPVQNNGGFEFDAQIPSKNNNQSQPQGQREFNAQTAYSQQQPQGLSEFTFDQKADTQQQKNPDQDDFFSYGGGQAIQDKGGQNQGFNDFGFDNFNGDPGNGPPNNNFFGNEQQEDNQAGGSDEKRNESPSDDKTGESAFKSFPQESPEKFQNDFSNPNNTFINSVKPISQPESAKPESEEIGGKDIHPNKLSPNKEIFDYAEEMASRKKTGPTLNQLTNTSRVMMPASGQFDETTESMGSKMSEEILEKLKNDKDKEVEKEIKKLREYLQKDVRISRWWLGQQGQASNQLQESLQQNYSFHQKSLMNKISQQISQSEQLQSQIYSVEQENKMLSEKCQQMIDNQTDDARRVQELEFEVDSFNTQIGIIRQQCEIELRRKDQDVHEMRKSMEVMKREVEEANRKSEQVHDIELAMNQKLATKDEEIERLKQELSDTQLDSQLHQQKISNFDMDKRDFENQIRNLQTQLADEISRSEISQANDNNAAAAKEQLQQQFAHKESQMQAKIAELEAQLSMALMQDINSTMKGASDKAAEKDKEELKPQIDMNQAFNLPSNSPNQGHSQPQIEKQLEIKSKQDSASSGTNIFNKPRVSSTQVSQQSKQNQNMNQFIDFSNSSQSAVGSQSMVVHQNQNNQRQDIDKSKHTMPFQVKNQNSPINNIPNNISPVSGGPGATSQVVAPNPSFNFDMVGTGTPSKPQLQERPSSSLGGVGPKQSPSPINNMLRQQSQQNLVQQSPQAQSQQNQQNLTPRQQRVNFQQQPSQLTGQGTQNPGSQNFDRRSMMPPVSNNQDLARAQGVQQSPGLQQSMSQQSQNTAPNPQNFATQQPSQMQNQFQQNFQHELLKQKLQSFHHNSLLQGDKCVIYEDVNVKIGLVRQYKPPQGPNGDLKCMFKVFFRNHNQQSLPMHGVFVQFHHSESQAQNNIVRIHRSSRPLPIKVPNTPPLGHNETIELDCEISVHPNPKSQGMSPQNGQIQGLNQLKFGSIQLSLQYELNNGKKSGLLPITVPINVLNLMAPYKSLNKYEYQGIWNKVVNTHPNQRPSNTACIQRMFQLDKQKVQNMQKLMQTMTHCFQHVPEVDPQPNQISFAAQLKDVCLSDVVNQERAWILLKMELTKDGGGCKIQCVSVKDNMQLAQPVLESVLGLVSKQQ